jgi:hypothetical protein
MEVEAFMMDGSWLGMITTSEEEIARSEPSAVQAIASEAGRTEEDTTKVSLEVMVMEQGPTSVLPAPSTARETVPMEVSRQEVPAAPGSDEESP